jgi:hypothetical protein
MIFGDGIATSWPFVPPKKIRLSSEIYGISFFATVKEVKTIIQITNSLAEDSVLNIQIDPECRNGDELTVIWSAFDSMIMTFGQGFVSPPIQCSSMKSYVQKFEYVNSLFVSIAEAVTLDITLQ